MFDLFYSQNNQICLLLHIIKSLMIFLKNKYVYERPSRLKVMGLLYGTFQTGATLHSIQLEEIIF